MNYHNITTDDMLNGEGLRTVLWVAGCNHQCKNCHNPITWDAKGGLSFDTEAEAELLQKIAPDYISGVTFSGGDPLYPDNREEITALAEKIKQQFPHKSIWLYTGYLWEEIHDLPILKYIDVLVDGKFIEEQKDVKLHWKGSANQRVIDVQQTLTRGSISLYVEA